MPEEQKTKQQQDSQHVGNNVQLVTFRLKDETFGINVLHVQEVLRLTDIAPVPGAADGVLGIINLRGTVVTVLDTRLRLGIEPGLPTPTSRIVIVEVGEHRCGLLVDAVTEVVDISENDIEAAPQVGADRGQELVSGITNITGKLIVVINLDNLLTEAADAQ